MTYTESPEFRAAWDAPGVDPRMLKAVALIFVELMIVTAIALFFSTFSTPILAAALTFGFYVVGNFSADLKNFDRIVDSRSAIWLARGVYHVLPDFSAFDVKMEVVHGLPVAAGYVAGTIVYGLVYITGLLIVSVLDLLAKGLQVIRGRAFVLGIVAAIALPGVGDRPAASPATASIHAKRRRSAPFSTFARRRRCAGSRCRSTPSSPTSTGSARSSTTAATAAIRRR